MDTKFKKDALADKQKKNACPLIISCHIWHFQRDEHASKISYPNTTSNPPAHKILSFVLHLHAKQEVIFWNIVLNICLKLFAAHLKSHISFSVSVLCKQLLSNEYHLFALSQQKNRK